MTLATRCWSRKGPFLIERAIVFSPLLTPLDDELVGRLLLRPSLIALGRLAPRSDRMPPLRTTLTTTVRVVNRVHRSATNRGPSSKPARAPGLSYDLILMLEVSHLANGRAALKVHAPELSAGQPKQHQASLFGHHLSVGPGGPTHLPTTSHLQFHVVHPGAQRNGSQPHAVSRLNISLVIGDDLRTDLQAVRRQNVSFLAIHEVDQGDSSAAVGIVFDSRDAPRNTELVAPKINHTIATLVPAAAVAGCDPPRVPASTRAALRSKELLLRLRGCNLLEIRDTHEPSRRGRRLEFARTHCYSRLRLKKVEDVAVR